jgi:hypothetical protein
MNRSFREYDKPEFQWKKAKALVSAVPKHESFFLLKPPAMQGWPANVSMDLRQGWLFLLTFHFPGQLPVPKG